MSGWQNYPPPPYPYPYPYPPVNMGPTDNDQYKDYLKKELKRAKRASKEGELKKKNEKKPEIWKRAEIVFILFFTAPLLGPAWIGILKLSWMLTSNLVSQH